MLRLLTQRALARVAPPLALMAALALSACGESEAKSTSTAGASDIQAFDSTSLLALPESATVESDEPAAPRKRLSLLADSIANQVTFLATFQRAFVAAGRKHDLLVDIGRIDTKLATPERLRAFREAASARAPLAVGDRLRLRGPWGESDATVSGYREWNGRAVVTMDLPPLVDSLARRIEPMVALALRVDSAAPPVADSCDRRGELSGRLAARATAVGDSLIAVMRADTAGKPAAMGKPPVSKVTRLAGCFGDYDAIVFADLAATSREPARELAVLLDHDGNVTPLSVNDLRFKTHEALRAFDADGDGVDDVAALGRAERSGGTVVLRLDPEKHRLMYIVSGFAWETF
jgi:hypothetical protein